MSTIKVPTRFGSPQGRRRCAGCTVRSIFKCTSWPGQTGSARPAELDAVTPLGMRSQPGATMPRPSLPLADEGLDHHLGGGRSRRSRIAQRRAPPDVAGVRPSINLAQSPTARGIAALEIQGHHRAALRRFPLPTQYISVFGRSRSKPMSGRAGSRLKNTDVPHCGANQ